MAKNNISSNHRSKMVRKTIFYLFIFFLAFMMITPLMYLTTTSTSSLIELQDFPRTMLPRFNHNVEFGWYEDWDMYYVSRLNNEGEYEMLNFCADDDIEKFVDYFDSKFNVTITEEELTEIMLPALRTDEIVRTKLKKDIFGNYEKFILQNTSENMTFWEYPIVVSFMNSVKASIYTIILALSIGGSLGYALARTSIKGKEAIGVGALIVRMFPTIAISVSAAIMLINFGFFDTMFGLAIIYAIPNIGLTAWITRGIFMGVNKELEEASQVFGASKLQTFMKITLPLVLPAFAASSMYAFITAWNDTGVALLLTDSNKTLSLILYNVSVGGLSSIHYAAAGSIVLIIPAAFFTFYLRKYINQLWG